MLVTSHNRSMSGGVNTRSAGREIAPNEATDLLNADISVPGLRTKRLEPETAVVLQLSELPVQTICPAGVQVTPIEVFWVDAVGESGFRINVWFTSRGCGTGDLVYTSPDLPANTSSHVIPDSVFSVQPAQYAWNVTALGNGSTTVDTVSDCCVINVGIEQPPCIDLGTPTLVSPIDGVTPPCNPVEFEWVGVPNAAGYIVRIYLGASGGSPVHESPVLPPSQTTYSQTLTIGQTYYWSVQAIGDGTVYCSGTETDRENFNGACVYVLSGTQNFGPCGGGGTVAIDTNGPSCAWTASTGTAWITLTGQLTGTGDGSVTFSVSANTTGSSRVGSISAGGQSHTVQQTACAYSIAPSKDTVACAGGSGSFAVATESCCTWTAVSNAAWLTVTSGASGTGNGTVGWSASINPDAGARSGTITAAGQTFTVDQPGGCAAPSSCPPAGTLNVTYTISGFTLSTFDGASCSAGQVGTIDVWGGQFVSDSSPLPPSTCRWSIAGNFLQWSNTRNTCLAYSSAQSDIRLVSSEWKVRVLVENGGSGVDIWSGTKATGETPAGVYTRDSGCSATPATITIA